MKNDGLPSCFGQAGVLPVGVFASFHPGTGGDGLSQFNAHRLVDAFGKYFLDAYFGKENRNLQPDCRRFDLPAGDYGSGGWHAGAGNAFLAWDTGIGAGEVWRWEGELALSGRYLYGRGSGMGLTVLVEMVLGRGRNNSITPLSLFLLLKYLL